MVGVDKNKLTDLFKKKEEVAKKEVKKEVKKTAPKTVKRTSAKAQKTTAEINAVVKALKDKNAAAKKNAKKMMHSKTHQDLINAAYKAAEELKVAPWVLLRAAEWGHFTDDRGKKYDGPVIDDLEGLDDDQKKALKKAVGL